MDGNSVNPDVCVFCKKKVYGDKTEWSTLTQKGIDGINKASSQRGVTIAVMVGNKVHKNCRTQHINPKEITLSQKTLPSNNMKRTTRECSITFDNKTDCLFCGKVILRDSNSSSVVTDIFKDSILKCCENRGPNDEVAVTVRGRIAYFQDLHAADFVYHHTCDSMFRSGKNLPQKYQTGSNSKRQKGGRPKNLEKNEAFSRLCSYLVDTDDEQITISNLGEKMQEFLTDKNTDAYSNRWLKKKLKDHFNDSIYISEVEGCPDLVTLREKNSEILRSHFKSTQRDLDEESQKRIIIETAARLLKSDIISNVLSETNLYPSTESLSLNSSLEYIPSSLKLLLDNLFVGKSTERKVASIGQAIIQAVRPRAVLMPLQIGLAVQMHHLNRSKFILDTLSEMGFCSSYKEVLRFEKNAANCVAPDLLGEDIDAPGTLLLFAGDNVDHNIRTLDGKGTFHGMGMMAALTPGRKNFSIIPRMKVADINIVERTKIEIKQYCIVSHECENVMFLELPKPIICNWNVDIFWELSCTYQQPVPNWQGMMHTIYQGNEHPGRSSIIYLPMIDMYSGNKTCIVSTLEYIYKLAAKHKVIAIITFDQPLYWKAAEIILDEPQTSQLKNIVLMLGSFHTFMNLLGAIGTLMQGTGLQNILELVYGENAVVHMMTGKSVQRAFRGHLLVDKCLNQAILSDLMNIDHDFKSLVGEAEIIYTSLIKREMAMENIEKSEKLNKIKETIKRTKAELRARSRTSQLWLNYQNMLQVAKSLIMADRSGSWQKLKQALYDSLPILAAAGHYKYLKSVYFFLQDMGELPIKHPEVHNQFERGFHVIRRSDQFWAGLGCDLVIEQTLMRSLKGTGGLTHGSGMTEEQRSLWTMSVPITSEYNNAMQDFNNLSYTTSEQHKESMQSRIKRDYSDQAKIYSKFVAFSPFSPDASLRNIINGVVAKDNVNVHNFELVGTKIIENMIGKSVFSFSFKRKDKVITMGDESAIKVAPDQTIPSDLLLQRFLFVSQTEDITLDEVIEYELNPFPPSVFEAKNLLRKADKPQLAHTLVDHCRIVKRESIKDTKPLTECYVLDGGSLLHRLSWTNGHSYGAIAQSYVDFTILHYGLSTVVFDGYEGGPSIKDNTHQRRGHNIHPVVSFTAETEFSGKKENFLSRNCNKQQFINLVSSKLRIKGCNVIQAPGDADVIIVKTAVESANLYSTALIGEDTDLLILLLYHTTKQCKDLYFYSDSQSKDVKVYHINIIKSVLGEELSAQLLFAHAFTGCDTTSRIFSIGKKAVFQKLLKDSTLQSCANTFISTGQSQECIIETGKKAMAIIFGGNGDDSLGSIRYNLFRKKVVFAKSYVTLQRLPPTSSATSCHSLRVYLQIMEWIGMENIMDPVKWGWKLEANQLLPIMSTTRVAPENLLKMIHCNCTAACTTSRCSCRKYGLPCTSACGRCQLESCDNPNEVEFDNDVDNDE